MFTFEGTKEANAAVLSSRTRIVCFETPVNPTLEVVVIDALASQCVIKATARRPIQEVLRHAAHRPTRSS